MAYEAREEYNYGYKYNPRHVLQFLSALLMVITCISGCAEPSSSDAPIDLTKFKLTYDLPAPYVEPDDDGQIFIPPVRNDVRESPEFSVGPVGVGGPDEAKERADAKIAEATAQQEWYGFAETPTLTLHKAGERPYWLARFRCVANCYGDHWTGYAYTHLDGRVVGVLFLDDPYVHQSAVEHVFSTMRFVPRVDYSTDVAY